MPYYKDSNNNLHELDSAAFIYLLPAGTVEISSEEYEAIRAANQPPADPADEKRAERMLISQEMMRSGFFEVTALVSLDYYLEKVRQLPAASGMTNEQIDAALSNEASPYYNANYVKAKTYYERLKNAGGE